MEQSYSLESEGNRIKLAVALGLILTDARKRLAKIDSGEIAVSDRFGPGTMIRDMHLQADQELGQFIQTRLLYLGLSTRVTVEGITEMTLESWSGRKPCWFACDPLDGVLNWQKKGPTIGLPFGACITVLDKDADATFGDIAVAVAIDYRTGDIWLSWRQTDGSFFTTFKNVELRLDCQDEVLDISRSIVIGEMYYLESRRHVAEAFPTEEGWLRNPGSSLLEMCFVSAGVAAAYFCDRQRQHELGAAYAIVRGSGGAVLDLNGKDLADTPFTFNTQTGVVLAANTALAENFLRRTGHI